MGSYESRIALARLIRERLPWSSVVAGAPGHPFIQIDRGETIVGSTKNSAWSRSVIGSRYLLWERQRNYVELCEHIHCSARYATAWKVVKTYPAPPYKGRGWMERAATQLVKLAKVRLRPVPKEKVDVQLRPNERFEIRIHPLTDRRD